MKQFTNTNITVVLSTLAVTALAIGFVVLISSWYMSCWGNYSNTLKAIGKPMQENVLAFFKEHQRYPNLDESISLMEKSGCKNIQKIKNDYNFVYTGKTFDDILAKMTGYNCTYDSTVITVTVKIANLSRKSNPKAPYELGVRKRNSRCSVRFSKDGTVYGPKGYNSCWQDSCMKPWNA